MNRHRGHSLVELLVTMSIGTTLLVTAVGVLHRTMRFESSSRREADVSRTLIRLAHDFRDDAHRAQDLDIPDNQTSPSIQLTLPNEEPVTYSVREGMVLREQHLPDGQVHREPYYLPPGYHVTFAQAFRPRRAVLHGEHDHGLVGEAPRTDVHVEAEVGRLLRLAKFEEPKP